MTEPYVICKARLVELWDAADVPLRFPNEGFTVPNPARPWVIVEFSGDLYDQSSIGSDPRTANAFRERGWLDFHVMAPIGTGEERARAIARDLIDLFRGEDLGALHFEEASIGRGETGDDAGMWWRISARIEWYCDS